MKRRTAEQFSWFKFMQIPKLSIEAKKIIYKALRKKKISIEQLFFLNKYEFKQVFPEFGKEEFENFSIQNIKFTNSKNIRKQFENIREDIHVLPITSKYYPSKIRERLQLETPPLFFGVGHLPLVNNPTIAILGSEQIDNLEIKLTWQLGTHFAKQGYNVLSNHTWGISEHAHKSALTADGTTTGILSKGINDFVVRQNIRAFGWEINSLFLSSFLPSESSDLDKEIQRAKLIAAWSDALVIVHSDYYKDLDNPSNGNIAAAVFATKNNIPTFLPNTTALSKVSLGNMEILRAGAKEFSRPSDITKFLQKKK